LSNAPGCSSARPVGPSARLEIPKPKCMAYKEGVRKIGSRWTRFICVGRWASVRQNPKIVDMDVQSTERHREQVSAVFGRSRGLWR